MCEKVILGQNVIFGNVRLHDRKKCCSNACKDLVFGMIRKLREIDLKFDKIEGIERPKRKMYYRGDF